MLPPKDIIFNLRVKYICQDKGVNVKSEDKDEDIRSMLREVFY